MADVDPQFLAISDMMVLTALDRAFARTVKRAQRTVPAAARHSQYIHFPIPEEKFEAVLHDAWALCPLMATRYDLACDVIVWMDALDGYTRALLMMGEAHSPERLTATLQRVPDESDEWSDSDGG